MKIHCPACNALFTLDAALQGEAAREAVLTALALPAPLAKALVRYLACFAPVRRQLAWERVAALLGELRAAIDAGCVTRNGRTWPAPQEYWVMALDTVLQAREAGKLTLPLKSHGYLYEVIAGLGNKAEALRERADDMRRAGITPGAQHASHVMVKVEATQGTPMPEETRRLLRRRLAVEPKGDEQ